MSLAEAGPNHEPSIRGDRIAPARMIRVSGPIGCGLPSGIAWMYRRPLRPSTPRSKPRSSVRKPGAPAEKENPPCRQGLGLSGPGGKDGHGCGSSSRRRIGGEHPLAVRGQGEADSLAQLHRRRAVGAAKVDDRLPSAALADLVQQEHPAVRGQVGDVRPVQPGELALNRIQGRGEPHASGQREMPEQDPPVRRNIVELDAARHPHHEPALPERSTAQRAGASPGCSCAVNQTSRPPGLQQGEPSGRPIPRTAPAGLSLAADDATALEPSIPSRARPSGRPATRVATRPSGRSTFPMGNSRRDGRRPRARRPTPFRPARSRRPRRERPRGPAAAFRPPSAPGRGSPCRGPGRLQLDRQLVRRARPRECRRRTRIARTRGCRFGPVELVAQRVADPSRPINDRVAVRGEPRVAMLPWRNVSRVNFGADGGALMRPRASQPAAAAAARTARPKRRARDPAARPWRRREQRFRAAGDLRDVVADAGEVPCQVPRRRVPLLPILGQAAIQHPAHRQREIGTEPGDGLRLFPHDRRHRLGSRLLLERLLPGRQLVEDRAQRELVGAKIQRPLPRPAPATCTRPSPSPCRDASPAAPESASPTSLPTRARPASPARSPGS